MAHNAQYPAASMLGIKGDVDAGTVGVTSSATQILAANNGRISATIQNLGTAAVYLWPDNTVTTSKGLLLAGTATLTDTDSDGPWYGVVASGTVTVSYVEVS